MLVRSPVCCGKCSPFAGRRRRKAIYTYVQIALGCHLSEDGENSPERGRADMKSNL
jgi:hypothetical protein